MKRRSVLVGLGALAASAASMRAGALFHGIAAPLSSSYTAGRFGLTLAGGFAGWVTKFIGGSASVDVINEAVGMTHIMTSQLGNAIYQPLTFECGPQMGKALATAIVGTLQSNYPRVNGSVSACDLANKEIRAVSFTNALITSITFPTLDGGSKDAVTMSIGLAPETTKNTAGTGAVIGGSVASAAKSWTGSRFKLTINGIDTTALNKVDALAFSQTVIADVIGVTRDPTKYPAKVTTPTLAVTMPLSNAQSIMSWAKQFAISGGVAPSMQKTGSLQYLNDASEVLFTLNFFGLGAKRITISALDRNSTAAQTVRAELFMNYATLTMGQAAIFA